MRNGKTVLSRVSLIFTIHFDMKKMLVEGCAMDYDELYFRHDNYFGYGPEQFLLDHYHLIEVGKPILDIGAGQGRHSIYLAREGYTVHALEPSRVAINTIYEISKVEHLSIRIISSTFESFDLQADYSAILMFGLLQVLSWQLIDELIAKLDMWAKPDSLLFCSAFTTEDPTYERNARELKQVGKNSYIDSRNRYLTYLETNEILTLFPHQKVIHHWEGAGSEHRHGDGPSHFHGLVHAVLRR